MFRPGRDTSSVGQTDTRYADIASIALTPQSIHQSAWLLQNNEPQASSQQNQTLLQTKFDALGHITQHTDRAGRSAHYQYDSAARLLGMSDTQGYRSQLSLDTEGRTQMAGLYRPRPEAAPDMAQARTDAHYRAAYYWHDEQGRQTARLLPDGRLDSWSYNDANRLSEHIDGDEVRTRFLENADKQLQLRIAQTPDGWLRLNIGLDREYLLKRLKIPLGEHYEISVSLLGEEIKGVMLGPINVSAMIYNVVQGPRREFYEH